MKVIHKFPLTPADVQDIACPPWRPLSVQFQHGQLVLWAVVDLTRPTRTRRVFIRGTGEPLGEAETAPFLGTVQQSGGMLIWHIFTDPADVGV